MTAIDAQTHWMSAKIPNDQFLLFGFVGVGEPIEQIAAALQGRAVSIADLRLRVREVPGTLDHPYWVSAPVSEEQFRIHRPVSDWDACLADLAGRMCDHLDSATQAWRVHLYDGVHGAPGVGAAGTVVAVLQIAHALADGSRATRIARELFDTRPLAAAGHASSVMPFDVGSTVLAGLGVARVPLQLMTLISRGRRAHLAHRDLEKAIAAGDLEPPQPGRPRVAINSAPGDRREVRVVLTSAQRLRDIGQSVTVGALVVIGRALDRHLSSRPDDLRAEVTIAKPGPARARNHFRNAGVDLHVDETDSTRRASAIGDDLTAARRRTDHAVTGAESAAMQSVPAALLKWGVRSFDTAVVPELVTGHTVVSSVYRGEADLTLGGGTVRFTAGFPALSPVQSLTHGVHGIGDAVAISITASPDVVGDLDRYRDRLVEALR